MCWNVWNFVKLVSYNKCLLNLSFSKICFVKTWYVDSLYENMYLNFIVKHQLEKMILLEKETIRPYFFLSSVIKHKSIKHEYVSTIKYKIYIQQIIWDQYNWFDGPYIFSLLHLISKILIRFYACTWSFKLTLQLTKKIWVV